MDIDVSGSRVIVTAGADGIGRLISETFRAAGARVHICDVREDTLATALRDMPGVTGTPCDVADEGQVQRLFDEAVAVLGGLDVMVNNAGIAGPTAKLVDISAAEWRHTIDVNLNSMFHCCKRAIPLLQKAGGGSIVNLSSTAGRLGMPLRSPYSASKFGVVGLTRALAVELGPDDIRVNAILPGVIEGPRMRGTIARHAAALNVSLNEMTERYVSKNVLRRFVDPQDVADMILYLCSPSGRNITGQSVAIDADHQTLMS